jgi:hypothetical protein
VPCVSIVARMLTYICRVLASFIGTTFIQGLCVTVTVIHCFAIWPAAKGRNIRNRVSPGLELTSMLPLSFLTIR